MKEPFAIGNMLADKDRFLIAFNHHMKGAFEDLSDNSKKTKLIINGGNFL